MPRKYMDTKRDKDLRYRLEQLRAHQINSAPDAAEHLCMLQGIVVGARFGYDQPNDCFCQRRIVGGGFQTSRQAIDYIVTTVLASLGIDN